MLSIQKNFHSIIKKTGFDKIALFLSYISKRGIPLYENSYFPLCIRLENKSSTSTDISTGTYPAGIGSGLAGTGSGLPGSTNSDELEEKIELDKTVKPKVRLKSIFALSFLQKVEIYNRKINIHIFAMLYIYSSQSIFHNLQYLKFFYKVIVQVS